MTIDLTDGANANWMGFKANERGTKDDGRVQAIEIYPQDHQRAIVEVDYEDGEPVKIQTIDTTDAVDRGWIEEAHDWLWDEHLSDQDMF